MDAPEKISHNDISNDNLNQILKVLNPTGKAVAAEFFKPSSSNGVSPVCKNKGNKKSGCRIKKGAQKPCKNCPFKEYRPLDLRLLQNHVNGSGRRFGIYPLLNDNTTAWVAADLDNHDGKKNPVADLQRLAQICLALKIQYYIFSSNSGKGYHLYLFFDSPIPAVKGRALLLGLVERADIDISHTKDRQGSFDCIFPKQDSLDGLSLGNLIALPWSGVSYKKQKSTLYLDPNTFESYGESLKENIEFFLDNFEAVTKEDVDGLLGEMDIIIDETNNSNHSASQLPSANLSSINPVQVLLGVPEGERDDKIFRYACSLRARGLSKEETTFFAKIAADNCRPPFPHGQVEIKVESAWKYSEIDKVIDELNEKHACVMNGGSFVILNEIIDPVYSKKDITLSTVSDFRNRYMSEKIKNPNPAMLGKKKYVSTADVWLNSNKRRFYEGIIFEPGNKKSAGAKYYNLFNGFAVEPVKGDWSKFRGHIKNVICNGDDDLFQYQFAWMARNVQFPGGSRPGVAIVLRGEQGSGKGCFANNYGAIFGNHYIPVAEYHKVAGRFNGHLKDALIVFVDESFWVGNSSAEAIIKTMITEPVITVEEKFKDAYRLRNHKNLIIASNNDWVVPAGKKERRFFVVEVSDSHVDDFDYFDEIYKEMKNGGTEAMLYDLLKVDLSKVNLREIPQTQALMNQIEQSMDTIDKFWFEKLQGGVWRVQYVDQGIGLGKNQPREIEPAEYFPITGKYNEDEFFEFHWDDLEFVITEDLHDEYLKYCGKLRENKRVNKSLLVKEA